MSTAFNWSALAFILAAVALVIFMLAVPRLLGGRSAGIQKEEVFESGVVGAGNARMRLSAKFYLVAIFFVIFDLEALYLYAYAVSVVDVGWIGFTGAAVFIGILFVGLVYELRLGAMNWSPADKRGKKIRHDSAPIGFSLADITKFKGIDELRVDPTGKVPAQSSGRVNVSNDIAINKRHLATIDHINVTGRITTADFATANTSADAVSTRHLDGHGLDDTNDTTASKAINARNTPPTSDA